MLRPTMQTTSMTWHSMIPGSLTDFTVHRSGITVGLSVLSIMILGTLVHGGELLGTIIGDGTTIVGDGATAGIPHGDMDVTQDGTRVTDLIGDMQGIRALLLGVATADCPDIISRVADLLWLDARPSAHAQPAPAMDVSAELPDVRSVADAIQAL